MLPAKDFAAVLSAIKLVRVKSDTAIIREGEPGQSFFVLARGSVVVTKNRDDGSQIKLAVLHDRAIFGEMALIDKGPRDSVAEAIMDSYVCFIDRESFSRYLTRNPEMSLRLTKIFGLKFKRLGQKVEDLVFRNVYQRLAGLLLNLHEEYGYDKNDKTYIYVKLTHYDIASLIGSTRETTTASLNDFSMTNMKDDYL